MNMNVRTHWVPNVPMASTGAVYVPVSLPCEPWNSPTPKPQKVGPRIYADKTDPETKILNALRQGHTIFDHIMMAAFGTRNGKVDATGRKTLRAMLDKGQINCVKATHLAGHPYLWSIKDE